MNKFEAMFRNELLRSWRTVPGAKTFPVENMVGAPGVPDMYVAASGSGAWIELKYLEAFPKRGGIVKVDHFTAEQRIFLLQLGEGGVPAWLFVKVKESQSLTSSPGYYLFDWREAGEVYEGRDVAWWKTHQVIMADSEWRGVLWRILGV